jgi:hypothetical protein
VIAECYHLAGFIFVRTSASKISYTYNHTICCFFLNDPKNSTQKFLDTINSYSKVAVYKINLQKSSAFLYINNEQTEKEYRETIPFTIASKKKIKCLGVNLM